MGVVGAPRRAPQYKDKIKIKYKIKVWLWIKTGIKKQRRLCEAFRKPRPKLSQRAKKG
jgi:predicted XRE-type DNA-binding protein